ncbi:unnamed protein product [Ectocarpus sp. 12 AP-2014]
MAIRSVDEIINLSDSSKIPEKLAFKDLVKIIDPRIRDRAPRHTSLHFKIPGMLWGQPVYNAEKVEKMILRHYKSIGFKCAHLENREILIKWGGDADAHDPDDASTNDDTESDETGSATGFESGSESGSEPGSESTNTDSADTQDSENENDQDGSANTKCVTVEQVPLSKRLSIINNQMQRDM